MAQRITIIGGGPGGYTAAFTAAKAGAPVTLVEAAELGGTCLNCGCIPTKTLRASADALENVRRMAEFGIAGDCTAAKADMPAVRERKRRVIKTLRGGLEKSFARMKIRVVSGRGKLVNAGLVRVTGADGKVEDITGDKVILATGSKPFQLRGLPVDHTHILTSDDALELDYVPRRMLIVGGGVIGAELAFIFRTFGSQITIVEGLERILPVPSIDEDLSRLVQREMKKRGIAFQPASVAKSAVVDKDGVHVTLGPSPFAKVVPPESRVERTLDADVVLVAVGRTPNTEGLGLAEAGVALDARGWITVDDGLETNVKGVFAVGDILGPARIMLAHVASMEARSAVVNLMGGSSCMSYSVIPSAVFISPEIASVGLTEAQARARGLEIVCPQTAMRGLGKAQAMGELAGLFKLVVEANSGRLLGAHIAGAHASDLIAEPTLCMSLKACASDIADTVHAHPTLAEGLLETAQIVA